MRRTHLSSCVLRTKIESENSTGEYQLEKIVHPSLEIATGPLPAEEFILDILTIVPEDSFKYKDYMVEFQMLYKVKTVRIG